jgi:preprotein translocase subunit SecB
MAEPQASFNIEKLYVKDLSLELPNAPQVFMQADSPQLDVQIHNESQHVSDALYEVVVTVTVTAKSGDKTLFLAEVAQAGLFSIVNVPADEIDPLLGIGCPTILYPYVREVVSDIVTRSGFPPVLLAPVSFEALYMQRQQQQGAPDAPRIEIAH